MKAGRGLACPNLASGLSPPCPDDPLSYDFRRRGVAARKGSKPSRAATGRTTPIAPGTRSVISKGGRPPATLKVFDACWLNHHPQRRAGPSWRCRDKRRSGHRTAAGGRPLTPHRLTQSASRCPKGNPSSARGTLSTATGTKVTRATGSARLGSPRSLSLKLASAE